MTRADVLLVEDDTDLLKLIAMRLDRKSTRLNSSHRL